VLHLFSKDPVSLSRWYSTDASSPVWPTVVDSGLHIGKLLKDPEQSVHAAWQSIHALSPRVAQRILAWSSQTWPQMNRQAKADHAVCCHFLQCLDQIYPVTKSSAEDAVAFIDVQGIGVLDASRRMALNFCADILASGLSISSDNGKNSHEVSRYRATNRHRLSAQMRPSFVNSMYRSELNEILQANQSLSEAQGLTPAATIGLIRSATASTHPDLKSLALLVAGRLFQLKHQNDRAHHAWQMAAYEANGVGWGLLELVALTYICAERPHEWLEEKIQLDLRRLDTLARPLRPHHSRQHRVAFVKQYVYLNWQEKLTAEFLAEQVETSVRTLEMDFRDYEGVTLHEFVLLEKMKRAKKMLLDSTLSPGELAAACGFKSKAGFASAYIKVHGVSPTKERRRHQQHIKRLNDV
jgi:AraC-like DNA-binding protein